MKNTTAAARKMTPSWDLYKPNLALVREHYLGVVYLFFIPSLLAVLGSTLFGSPEITNSKLELTTQQTYGAILLLVSFIWQVINMGPLTVFQLRAADKTAGTNLGQYYKDGLQFSVRILFYYLVFGLLFLAGLIFFIIPGLIVLRRYFLAPYYLVDRKLSIRNAMKQSAANSKQYSGAIWGVIGVTIAIVFFASLIQAALPIVGIVIGEIIACTYLFLAVLRYREIEPKATSASSTKKA
ncbi:MAG TPA: hypothetical protein VGE30_02945 [Candidatus Saccharimonadales bacterium]